jgi:hypothetical protein
MVVACASAATRSATFAGEDRVPLADHVRCGFSPYPAARSGSRTERAEHARAGEHRERAHIDHVGDILTSRGHLGDRHTTV